MKIDLKTAIDTTLHQMDWHGEEEVLRRLRPARRRVRPRRAVIACALLLLLCGTAVALTLRFSQRYEAVSQARGALGARYGLTGDMLDLLGTSVERAEDGVVVTFRANALDNQAVGIYTVAIGADGRLDARWSHDDASPAEYAGGDLSSSVWGAQQLERLIALKRENAALRSEDYERMSLEERAAVDTPLLAIAQTTMYINIAPTKDDLPPEEARTLAMAAARKKYGVTPETLSECEEMLHFYLLGMSNERASHFVFYKPSSIYLVRIASPSGKVTYCSWMVDPINRTLPEVDLANYIEAAREYAQSGAFDALSASQKARVYQRYAEAGLSVLLPQGDYITPGGADISESAALAAARRALIAEYGFDDEDFSLFEARMALLRGKAERVWQVTFRGAEPGGHVFDKSKLGEYTAQVSAADGEIISCGWSLEGADAGDYTPGTFGGANAYSADMLPWLRELMAALGEIRARYTRDINVGEMSVEDAAAYCALMRGAGFDEKEYAHVLPEAGDMRMAQAVALARETLMSEYGCTAAALDGADTYVTLTMDYESLQSPARMWNLQFFITENNGWDDYHVHINAAEGVIENIWHDTPASGGVG